MVSSYSKRKSFLNSISRMWFVDISVGWAFPRNPQQKLWALGKLIYQGTSMAIHEIQVLPCLQESICEKPTGKGHLHLLQSRMPDSGREEERALLFWLCNYDSGSCQCVYPKVHGGLRNNIFHHNGNCIDVCWGSVCNDG